MAASGFGKVVDRAQQHGVQGNVEQRPVPDQAVEMQAHQHRVHPRNSR